MVGKNETPKPIKKRRKKVAEEPKKDLTFKERCLRILHIIRGFVVRNSMVCLISAAPPTTGDTGTTSGGRSRSSWCSVPVR